MLQKYDISYVLDVRSTPYSQFAESCNRENIKAALKQAGIAARTFFEIGIEV